MKSAEDLANDERDLQRKLRDADLIQQLVQHEGWKVFSGMLNEKLQNYVNALCVEDVEHDNTTKLRAKIGELRDLLKIPTLVATDIARHKKRVEGLRNKQDRLHSVGLDVSPLAGDPNAKQS